jgi:hypothetical protein
MWSVIPAVAIVLAQATQPAPSSKADKWCFDRGQGAQLCEETEASCNKLCGINTEIAQSPCKPGRAPQTQVSPTVPPAPPNPASQIPTQR